MRGGEKRDDYMDIVDGGVWHPGLEVVRGMFNHNTLHVKKRVHASRG